MLRFKIQNPQNCRSNGNLTSESHFSKTSIWMRKILSIKWLLTCSQIKNGKFLELSLKKKKTLLEHKMAQKDVLPQKVN